MASIGCRYCSISRCRIIHCAPNDLAKLACRFRTKRGLLSKIVNMNKESLVMKAGQKSPNILDHSNKNFESICNNQSRNESL